MSLAYARAAEPTAAPDLPATAAVEIDGATLQPRERDRRGPMRPQRLVPARARMSGAAVSAAFRTADAALFAAAACAAAVLAGLDPQRAAAVDFLPLATGVLLLGVLLPLFGAYGFGRREGPARHAARLMPALLLAAAGAWLAGLALGVSDTAEAAYGLWFFGSGALLLTAHAGWWLLVRRWRAGGQLTPNLVVVGATANAQALVRGAMDTGEAAVLGVFDDRWGTERAADDVAGVPVLGDTAALLGHRILPYVDRIVITVTASAHERVRQLVETLRVLPNPVTLFVDIEDGNGHSASLSRLADAPLARLSGVELAADRVLAKRVADLVFGVAALIVAAPVMLIVAIAVKLDSPGPILFRQRRHGFNNEEITVWKFRSMTWAERDLTAAKQVAYDDPRVTRVGKFIRKTSLDELPQVFNVLTGQMSLVGPRPHAIGMKTGDVESARLVAEYAWRHRIKPGVTGWAQINGSRGPVHTAADVRRRVQLDVEYIERQSFWFDLYILVMTLPRLLGDRAAIR